MKKLFSEIPYIKGDGVVLRQITRDDAEGLGRLVSSEKVYRYEPTILFERKYPDVNMVIDRLYDECLEESIILGVFEGDAFCGLAEFYGYSDSIHKVSVGLRFLEECWGRGLATKTLKLMVDYLYGETDIEIIAASSLPANIGSATILRKNGFELVVHNSDEDWGYEQPLPTDKWEPGGRFCGSFLIYFRTVFSWRYSFCIQIRSRTTSGGSNLTDSDSGSKELNGETTSGGIKIDFE